jgi:predicted DNA-binding transcriptional regulator AlpA
MNTNEARQMDDEQDGLWDANDVARFLKASKSWVYKRAEAGELPCIRIMGLLRFDPESIRAVARGLPATAGRIVALKK